MVEEGCKGSRAAGTDWIIVNFHKGPYTTSNHATDTDIQGPNGVRNKIAPLMAELGIDLVVQGHDHLYARSKPILKDGTAAPTTKITETSMAKRSSTRLIQQEASIRFLLLPVQRYTTKTKRLIRITRSL